MAGSFSQELEELLNPLPKFADPEDDGDEATKARVTEGFQEDEDEEDALGLSALRKNNTDLLPVTYGRYKGKRVTRQQLMMDMQGTGEEGGDDDDDDDDGDDVEDEEDEEGSMEDLEDEEIDSDDLGDADDDDEISDRKTQSSLIKKDGITFPQGVDFRKLTEGMDDLGVSGDDDDDDEDDEDGGESVEDTEGSDEEESTGDEEVDEDGGTVQTFSRQKVDEEVEKGKAVQNQLTLWDEMLKGRIKLQKALVTANQLPQPQTLPEFKRRGGAEVAGALKNTHKALKALQRSLLELHDQLLYQNAETRSVVLDEEPDEDEDGPLPGGGPPKRKLEMAEYPELAAKRFAAFQPYSNATLQKWHDKTRLNMGKSSKGFGAFERNILTQVEQVLMDQERLVRRTQTKRTEYRILGKKEATDVSSEAAPADDEDAQQPMKTNAHLKDLDEDIFDDDDFYHQLLRELIERKTSAADPNDQVAMGRQWLAIQKLRSKIKKKVDTKASKGRKVRFHIHSKLVNFMAPIDHSSMGDDARSELYRSLFGQSAAARE